MKKVMRAGGPIIWAHASTPAALDAMLEVLLRAQMIEPSLSYVLSAPASKYIFDIEVVRLQEENQRQLIPYLDSHRRQHRLQDVPCNT